MKSQCEQVLHYMEIHGSITQAEAVSRLNCYRLGARIFELKERGFPIKKEMESKRRADGTACSFARYSLGEVETHG